MRILGSETDLYPIGKAIPAPAVLIDIADAPEMQAWAEQARDLVREWFPLICQFLATEEYAPPATLTLQFKPEIHVPAYCSEGTITINAKWVAEHPDDFGMVIHEMVHVIQSYPDEGDVPAWLMEGLTDYIRFYRYEPDVPRPRIDPLKSKYTDAYRTTAAFLAWLSGKYDRRLIYRLDRLFRTGGYSPAFFVETAGKDIDTLWSEFVATVPAPQAAAI